MRPLTRADRLLLPAAAYRTYGIAAPADTHHRPATCAEVDCAAHLHGWVTTVDEATDLGQRQAHHIRSAAGRGYREERTAAGLTAFTFPPGQRCFRQHRTRVDRPELFYVRGGDWRGNPTGETYQHTRPADWVDDFATHQDRLATQQQRG